MAYSRTLTAIASWRGESADGGRARVGRVVGLLGAGIEAFLVATATPVLTRAAPSRMARLLEPRRAPGSCTDRDIHETLRLADAVLARGGPFVRPGCLSRGVTRYRMLRRAGADVSLCFGAGTVEGGFAAHCWVDHHGTPLWEHEDVEQFAEMYRIRRHGVVVVAG